MSTSGSANYSATRDEIITEALEICGVIAVGKTPTSGQLSSCARTLNFVIKAWQAHGLQLFRRKTYTITLVAGTKDYVFGSGGVVTEVPTRILHVHTSSTDGLDTELTPMSDIEYQQMANKATTSVNVNSYYYDFQQQTATLTVWPTPATGVTDVLKVRGERPIYDFDAAGDEADVPSYYFLALSYGLAMAISPKFGLDDTLSSDIQAKAQFYLNEALSYDVEYNTSLKVEPSA